MREARASWPLLLIAYALHKPRDKAACPSPRQAVDCGYWQLYRYDPRVAAQGGSLYPRLLAPLCRTENSLRAGALHADIQDLLQMPASSLKIAAALSRGLKLTLNGCPDLSSSAADSRPRSSAYNKGRRPKWRSRRTRRPSENQRPRHGRMQSTSGVSGEASEP